MMLMHETRKRSVAKTLSYRILSTIILGIISWAYTGELLATSAITITFTIVASVIFYLNERFWNRVNWEKK